MDCEELAQLLSRKVLAELSAEERAAVAAHVAECKACRQKHGLDEQSQELHDTVKALRCESDLTTSVMSRLEPHGGPAPGDEAGDEAGGDPATPQRLAGFEVLGLLGRGGMGNVFKARQVSMDRLVALKILPARLAQNGEFVQRLVQEARAAAKLRHPNIVHGYDVGEAGGHYYFAMEYVDGEGLDAILRREGAIEQGRALAALKQVASALAAAHAAGILHRDIKPSNIMLDSGGDVRVTDFGLATRLEGDIAAGGEALGTPAYAAPEICAGRPADARADLYSLGATFFHVLAGRPPFQDTDFSELVVKQVNEEPPPLASVAPHIDPRLCRIIDRLLRKDPAERYPSAQALLGDLEALGALRTGDATLQEAPTMPLRPGQKLLRQFEAEQRHGPRRGHRRRIALIAASVAVLCAVIGLLLLRRPRPPAGRQAARVTSTKTATPAERTPQARLEHDAEAVFRRAERAASLGQWVTVTRELDYLEREYGQTHFVASRSSAIAELRRKAMQHLEPGAIVQRPVRPVADRPDVVPLPREPLEWGDWTPMFDGASLTGWRVVPRFPQGAPGPGDGTGGPARVEDGRIVLDPGNPTTGIVRLGQFPMADYELRLEAMRLAGNGEFCSITFPLGDRFGTLYLGAQDGRAVGLHMFNGWELVAENPTTRRMEFADGQWYRVRLRVTWPRIEAWVDDERVLSVPGIGFDLRTVRWLTVMRPFGISTWRTQGAVRGIEVRQAKRGAPPPRPDEPGRWVSLFDGKTLSGWAVADAERFAKHGGVYAHEGRIVLEAGAPGTGIVWTGDFPRANYEVAFAVRREDRGSNHCHVLFPVGPSRCILNVGGWDGNVVGLSLVDGRWAPGNDTCKRMPLQTGRWYLVRLRVTDAKVEAWIDDEQAVDLARAGRQLTAVNWPAGAMPFCLSNWETQSAFRDIRVRRLEGQPDEPPAEGTRMQTASVAVPARADWLDTGLYLAEGQRYEFLATGAWGTEPASSHGPEGSPGPIRDDYPVPRGQPFALVGRVGAQGRSFVIGGGTAHRPARAGRLQVRMNDGRLCDNWGTARLRVDGPLVAAEEAPVLSRFTSLVRKVQVDSRSDWAFSGVEVERGDVLLLKAEGTWNVLGGEGEAGGRPVPAAGFEVLRRRLIERTGLDANGLDRGSAGHRMGALTGRIGRYGELFTIGTLYVLDAREAGRLYLAMHDDDRSDNRGSVTVSVLADPARQPHAGKPEEPHLDWRPIDTLRGHTSWVLACAFSPDGTLLATGGRDRTVRLWGASPDHRLSRRAPRAGELEEENPDRGRLLRTLAGHTGRVEAVAFSPDGQRLASASQDRTVRLWEVATGRCLHTLVGHGKGVVSVAFFPDGTRLASGSGDETMRIWDARTGRCVQTLQGILGEARLAVSPGGSKLASVGGGGAGRGGWLRVWDADTGACERRAFPRCDKGWAVAWSPDGERIAAGGDSPTAWLWSAATGECVQALTGQATDLRSLAFSPDGRWLAASSRFRTVVLWDAASGELARTLEGHPAEVKCVAFSPDGERLATASFDGTIRLWTLVPQEAEAAVEDGAPQDEPRPGEANGGAPRPPAE